MFFAIRKHAMSEGTAISLMPILFFAPWAIFCTVAGYLADKYSKRSTLVAWKLAEVGITLVALLGFWYSAPATAGKAGAWIVLSTVFLMGTHSAFFVPAKYGVLPEILPPALLSKGNGVLESTSFLAVILGTVSGGMLSFMFSGEEHYIGLILLTLAILGAAASMMIRPVPAANPDRPFPGWSPQRMFQPILANLRTLIRSRPLALSVLGIAFFTFMVTFMRATMYMHGESQNPRWDEFHTSLVVSVVALGIGLGSPIAGWLSGAKVELGLVPIGALGMILATLVAAISIHWIPGLVTCLILIGFFSGFYIVPLYSLLQHRAPKTAKGDLIATSNFINVTGAIAASVLFLLLVLGAKIVGLSTPVDPPPVDVAHGMLNRLIENNRHRPVAFQIGQDVNPHVFQVRANPEVEMAQPKTPEGLSPEDVVGWFFEDAYENNIEVDSGVRQGSKVIVSKYTLPGRDLDYYHIRAEGMPLVTPYNNEDVPRYLFIGASLMTAGILLLLCRQLPDFFVRSILWARSFGRYRTRILGIQHLPTEDPAILATNCRRFQDAMHVLGATDRTVRFLLSETERDDVPAPFLRSLAKQNGMIILAPTAADGELNMAAAEGNESLSKGHLVALNADSVPAFEHLLNALRSEYAVPIVPVYCFTQSSSSGRSHKVRVIIGEVLRTDTSPDDIRRCLERLVEEIAKPSHDGGPLSSIILKRSATTTDAPPKA
jgi:MFS family permease